MNKNIVWIVVLVVVAIVAFFVGRNTAVVSEQTAEAPKVEKAVQPAFAGAEKHEITKEEAQAYIERFQKKMMPKAKAAPEGWKGGSFDRAVIDKILAQPGCAQLRIYHALDEAGRQTFVLVGVDTAGKELIGTYAEKIFLCPPFCD